MRLVETSLSRILQHFDATGFALLSPYRPDTEQCPEDGEVTPEENQKRFSQLKAKVKAAGYGYVPMTGYWEGQAGDCDYTGKEESLFIPNSQGSDLRSLLLQWAREYNQDAVLWSPGEGVVEVIDQEGNVLDSYTNFRVDEPTDLYSMLNKGTKTAQQKRISFSKAPARLGEWKQISGPRTWGEALKRKALGEILHPAMFANK